MTSDMSEGRRGVQGRGKENLDKKKNRKNYFHVRKEDYGEKKLSERS